jgi:hypothetical protein
MCQKIDKKSTKFARSYRKNFAFQFKTSGNEFSSDSLLVTDLVPVFGSKNGTHPLNDVMYRGEVFDKKGRGIFEAVTDLVPSATRNSNLM